MIQAPSVPTIPTMTTTHAASLSPSERMPQNALTAGRTESESVRLSTRYDPARRRITSRATPATIQPIAIARTSLRRRPGTSQSAAAHRSSAGTQIQAATVFSACVRLWAVSS